ncbi:MAG TPA: beta-N-acetylhexosaminidase, partial [Verrucomicrobiae bacterium]
MAASFKLAGLLIWLMLARGYLAAAESHDLAIIPQPRQVDWMGAGWQLGPDAVLVARRAAQPTADWLAQHLRPATGYDFPVTAKPARENTAQIALTLDPGLDQVGQEGYELTVQTNGIRLRAPTPAGLFYACQTLLQLLPSEIFATNRVTNVAWQVPGVRITDWPRFKWRGLMLDVSRHFYPPNEVERVLDEMALHKLNTFHWHLTDDQGWRIEIKKYPRLTQVGAWRDDIGFGLPTNASTAYGADGRYGGYYTQSAIKEVVQYAAARHITVVPEIEMPGHATAALVAYPQYGCSGQTYAIQMKGGVFHGIYDPAKEETYRFLEDILTEVFVLFPGQYVHIGGDEVRKETWHQAADCQALMQREGLKSEAELQAWFTRRMETFVRSHGKTLIGWTEIAEGGMPKEAAIMDWIGGGREAAAAGRDVVMSPTKYCYLDHYQNTNHAAEPKAIGGYLPLAQVYQFDPVPADLEPAAAAHILGGQGNLWTEYVPNLGQVEYMFWPRAAAL